MQEVKILKIKNSVSNPNNADRHYKFGKRPPASVNVEDNGGVRTAGRRDTTKSYRPEMAEKILQRMKKQSDYRTMHSVKC